MAGTNQGEANEHSGFDIVVFASGQGSNFAALAQSFQDRIACLVVNEKNAGARNIAENYQIPCLIIPHTDFPDRSSFESELVNRLRLFQKTKDLRLILLAGFMRVLSKTYFEEVRRHFPQATTLNIHPAHLFEYKGAKAYRTAIDSRANRWGISVHKVTPELDAGPVIASLDAPVFPWETELQLRKRMQSYEHVLYVAAVSKALHASLTPELQNLHMRKIAELLAGLPDFVSVQFNADFLNPAFNTPSDDKR